MSRRLLRSPVAADRLTEARRWLLAQPAGAEVVIVAPHPAAGHELVRAAAEQAGAAFGWRRMTLGRWAAELAGPTLLAGGLAPVGMLGVEAVAARAVARVGEAGELGRYGGLRETPGFARALARVLAEVREAGLDPGDLQEIAPELAALARTFDEELARAGLVDRAGVVALAVAAAERAAPRPLLLVDLPVRARCEQRLVAALVRRAPEVLATLPEGDERSAEALAKAFDVAAEEIEPAGRSSLARLQRHLFGAAPAGDAKPLDGTVAVLSAPGESRESAEIARRILALAAEGVAFDQVAVLLRAPEEYRPHLAEAFARAGIPAWFDRGARRPHPAGRAFLALLRCAAEQLSARRFAEYLSLAEVPSATAAGTPPAARPDGERWVAPDEELVGERLGEALAGLRSEAAPRGPGESSAVAGEEPVVAGTLRAPRRWERLLVEAAVIGGLDRWERRLGGLERELEMALREVEDAEEPAAERTRRSIDDLRALRDFALPVLAELAELPELSSWSGWLERLSALATRSLRHPDGVLALLAQLAPLGPVEGVRLTEVIRVLERHLLEVTLPPAAARYGRVLVAPVSAARGMDFEVVFVPGLAERVFPRKISEEPLLLDAVRERLGAGLPVNRDRVGDERLALRLALGAARRQVVLSYPRIDLEQGRPRVPSFYALEALRAAEGRLPLVEELVQQAEAATASRAGWPAPRDPAVAIDEAEFDLALLERLSAADLEESTGAASYLLDANPHLARALRFRARRWHDRWTWADGLVHPEPPGRAALDRHRLGARSFSPTALQHYASCPYRFFLYAMHKLAPREQVEAIEELDPLQRGSLVHDTLFEVQVRLQAAGLLPVTAARLDAARSVLERTLDEVAARYHEDLAPAIERVWEAEIEGIRADLREWLRLVSEDVSGFVPWRFELSFGLPGRLPRDPHSVDAPVPVGGGLRLRGSIDLLERDADGALRVTDYKTGRARFAEGGVIGGGGTLQPVLYALAAEQLFAGQQVVSGRLFYCTSAGGFEEREVPLDDDAREAGQRVAEIIGRAIEDGFLPAAPAPRACEWCDYFAVCGPGEERRVARKPAGPLRRLAQLREER